MEDCLFCMIAEGKIPSKKLYEDDQVVAFYDINPQAKVHFLVVPRKHISSAAALTEEDGALLGHIFAVIAKLAKEQGLENGYRIISNVGEDAGQTVKHLHFHVLGGLPVEGGILWCATEKVSRAVLDETAAVVKEVLSK